MDKEALIDELEDDKEAVTVRLLRELVFETMRALGKKWEAIVATSITAFAAQLKKGAENGLEMREEFWGNRLNYLEQFDPIHLDWSLNCGSNKLFGYELYTCSILVNHLF